ncbi:MAG: squalene--hopene cyclase, partial [Acidobacteria bacterium]|nr:squalene--hopene cyclase [Acidobacteriota bacterium]
DQPARKGVGLSTAAQTSWALLALLAGGVHSGPVIERGVDYLLSTQREDGSWYDEAWTGTGFPRVFYLRYHLYAVFFPLTVLAELQRLEHAVRRSPYPLEVAVHSASEQGAAR